MEQNQNNLVTVLSFHLLETKKTLQNGLLFTLTVTEPMGFINYWLWTKVIQTFII